MQWSRIQANVSKFRNLIKARWSNLTEGEIDATGGDRKKLVELIQKKYSIDADQAERQLTLWSDGVVPPEGLVDAPQPVVRATPPHSTTSSPSTPQAPKPFDTTKKP